MKKIFILLVTLTMYSGSAQTGINTMNPKATLHVMEDTTDPNLAVGIIAPLLSGNQLKSKENLYQTSHTGAIVYVTEAANPTNAFTRHVTKPGYYYFDGVTWKGFESDIDVEGDATRFLGGTVYVYNNSTTVPGGGVSLSDDRVIGGSNDQNYTIGTLSVSSSKGGIMSVLGNGYTISNVSAGIFDIKFDVPLEEIYGISVNVYDSYTSTSTPTETTPGSLLNTRDNSQVAFISNNIIRIKTGDDGGTLSNKTFTFLVTGQ